MDTHDSELSIAFRNYRFARLLLPNTPPSRHFIVRDLTPHVWPKNLKLSPAPLASPPNNKENP